MSARNFIESYKFQNDNINGNHSCFFNEIDEETKFKNLTLKYEDEDKEIIIDYIEPHFITNHKPVINELVPCIEFTPTNERLLYLRRHWFENPTGFTFMLWFKPNSNNYEPCVFSINDKFDFVSFYFGIRINSQNKIEIDIHVNYNNLVDDVSIPTDMTVNIDSWNFLGVGVVDNKFYIVLNDNCLKDPIIISQIDHSFISQIYVGCYYVSSAYNKLNGYISGLSMNCNKGMDNYEMFNYYLLSKEYVFERKFLDKELKTINMQSTHLYNHILLNVYDLIPLNQTFNSINGMKPIIDNLRSPHCYDNDRTFSYNNVIKRYAYVAYGGRLEYDFTPEFVTNAATLSMRVYIMENKNCQYIFQKQDCYGRTLGLYRSETDVLVLETDGVQYSTGLILHNNIWNLISFSYRLTYDNDPEYGTVYYFTIYSDSGKYSKSIPFSYKYDLFKTSIGRRFEASAENEVNPLYGQIEMITYRNSTSSDSTYSSLKEYLKVITKEKEYDAFDHIRKETLSLEGNVFLEHKYNYKKLSNEKRTNLIDNEILETANEQIYFNYEYDSNNNITLIEENGIAKREYSYNYAGGLSFERFLDTNKAVGYHYDNNSNIVAKHTYLSGSDQPIESINYVYDPKWKDRLIKFGAYGQEKDIKYHDASPGNPTYIVDRDSGLGIHLTWEGRRLINYNDTTKGLSLEFTYNSEGLRKTKKNLNTGEISKYYYENNILICEVVGPNSKIFLYDESGILYGIKYNGLNYYYLRNIIGNIIGILDFKNDIVVKYDYDAYGNIMNITGSGKDGIGKVNPFIYKGYYFDFETGLYLLTTRYYNPEWGRFLNADDVSYLDPESICGLNLYAYCGNNPIMRIDPNGNAWYHWVIGGAIIVGLGIALVATAGGIAPAIAALGTIFTTSMASSATVATLAGAFAGATILGTAGVVVGGLIGKESGVGFWEGASQGFMIGSISGAVIGGAWGYSHYALQNAGKMAVRMETKSLVPNPTNPMTDEGVSYWTKTLSQNNFKGYNSLPNAYGDITTIDVFRGTNMISNGHHRISVLLKYGVEYVNVFLI